MRNIEVLLAMLLSFIVVVDFDFPNVVAKTLKSPLGMIAVLGCVMYLFTKSSILGILGILAGFSMVQRAGAFIPKYSAYNSKMSTVNYNNDPPMSNAVTLEETMVNNMVPVVNSVGKSSFTTNVSSVHCASNVF
jgi:hypothetical protein